MRTVVLCTRYFSLPPVPPACASLGPSLRAGGSGSAPYSAVWPPWSSVLGTLQCGPSELRVGASAVWPPGSSVLGTLQCGPPSEQPFGALVLPCVMRGSSVPSSPLGLALVCPGHRPWSSRGADGGDSGMGMGLRELRAGVGPARPQVWVAGRPRLQC